MKAEHLLRRFVLLFAAVVGVSLLVFVLLRAVPGDAATAMIGREGRVNPEEAARVRAHLGLDQPLPVQYLRWVSGLVTLDAGRSFATGTPVWEIVRGRVGITVELAILALGISLLVALPLGALAAVLRGTWVDHAVRLFTAAGLAVPGFWLGVLVVVLLASAFGYFPFLLYRSPADDPMRNLQHMLFPALILGWRMAAVTARMARSSLLEALGQDYTRTARAKGLSEPSVVLRHAARNAALPVVTVIGFQLGHLLGGAIVMEQVFNLPGLGRTLVEGIVARDYPVVQALVLIFALVMMASNLAVDVIYTRLDPRVRSG